MQVAFTCRHGNVRDEVREHITQKAGKLLTYFERVTAIDVTVEFVKDRTEVEVLVDTEHRHNFVARETGDDVTATFERALSKMEQQIKRYKEKIQDHRRDRALSEVPEAPAEESEGSDVQ